MGSSLAKRNFQVDPTCKICDAGEEILETRAHLFRDCGVVQRIWACPDLGIRVNCGPSMDIGEWVINWFKYLGKTEDAESKMIKFLGTLWCLWMYYGIWRSTVDIALQARDVGDSGGVASKGIGRGSDSSVWEVCDGRPFYVIGGATSCNSVKVMVDAGCKSVRNAALGWIAYVHDGATLFTRSVKITAQSALQAEALGLKDVLGWAREQGILHLEVSSDCLQLLLQLAGDEMAHHFTKGLLDDMDLYFPSFHCLCFTFIPRRFNKIAHDLAMRAMSN
ncbi:uncharacterized protein LOC141608513 [Silene latifolia]|uniref:uncharacterized protein LOC141608513 n=1 Tax=Silene latifolia TaxID=37657 RepID=UPI003D775D0E